MHAYVVTSALNRGAHKQFSWAELRAVSEMAASTEDNDRDLTLTLQAMAATEDALVEEGVYEVVTVGTATITEPEAASQSMHIVSQTEVEMSRYVIKWLEQADHRYRALFHERICQLASERRTYALSKRLQGTVTPVYESKLFGFRILWTTIRRQAPSMPAIFVWYVCTHDRISYFAERIDTSLSRMVQRPVLSSTQSGDECMELTEATVLLDPLRNTPLRVHACLTAELRQISDKEGWQPPLRLTQKQRTINSDIGSVLLVGRSGKHS